MVSRLARAGGIILSYRNSAILGNLYWNHLSPPYPLANPSVSLEINRYYSARKGTVGERALRMIGWLGGFYTRKSVLTRSAMKVYEDCIDNVDYETFIKECHLPDTFQSWFLIAHLHLWLLLVRLKREGKEGKYFISRLVSFFWKDVEDRMKLLGINSRDIHKSLQELNEELRGLIVAYEEGLLINDRALAGALWRNWVHDKTTTDPEMLSLLVMYIRSQVYEMDKTDSNDLLTNGASNMLPLTLNRSKTL